MSERLCSDPECRGDCTWCNRADVENQDFTKPVQLADPALRDSIRRIQCANGDPLAKDARRVLRALELAAEKLQRPRAS